jgi:hypothetical protein
MDLSLDVERWTFDVERLISDVILLTSDSCPPHLQQGQPHITAAHPKQALLPADSSFACFSKESGLTLVAVDELHQLTVSEGKALFIAC